LVDWLVPGLQKLHTGGARFVFIFNQPPAGCTPLYLTLFSEKSAKDEFGCLAAYNAAFQTLNVKLKAAVETYRQLWPDTIFLHYDWYAAQDEVVRNPAKYGTCHVHFAFAFSHIDQLKNILFQLYVQKKIGFTTTNPSN
jgi:phospholipase/lecithinase/hemolysin